MPDLHYKKGAEQSAPFLFLPAVLTAVFSGWNTYLDGRE
jgi:hypothetical protein